MLEATVFASRLFRSVSLSGLSVPVKIDLDLCALRAQCIGQIHSEILQGFLVVFYLRCLSALVHISLAKFHILTFLRQDMVHNFQYLMGQCHQGSLFAPACCQSFIALREECVLCPARSPGAFGNHRFRLLVAVVRV